MADKTIGSLLQASALTDDSSFVCEDSGEAKRVTGKQFKDFAKSGAVEAQLASEEAAKKALASEEAASNSASSASSSASIAETSAQTASQKANEANISATNAAASAKAAADSALQAETEAFIATYGETSYSDIDDAVHNGKVVLLYNHDAPAVGDAVTWYVPLKRFVRTENGDSYAEFSSFDAGAVTTFICTLHGYPSEWSTTVEKIGPKCLELVLDSVLWRSNTKTQEVEAIGVDDTEKQQLLMPVPARDTQLLYDECGIKLIDHRENHVTFSCETVPEYDVHVYLLIQEVGA